MRASIRTWYAMILFGFGVACLLYVKPRFMFREDGSMYDFGSGPDRSVFTFGIAVAALAVVSSFVFAMGDLMSGGGAPPPARRYAVSGAPAGPRVLPVPQPQPQPQPQYAVSSAPARPYAAKGPPPDPFSPDRIGIF